MKNTLSVLVILILSIAIAAQETKTEILKNCVLIDNTEAISLYPLKNMIGDSRIVLLGEGDHSSGNIFEAKVEVMKFLHQEMGFDIIAFESGLYDLKKAYEDIEQGKSVKLTLAKSIFPIWINTKEFLPFINYVEENKSDLLITGFDSQFSGSYVFENLKEDIEVFIKNDVSEEFFETWIEHVETMADDFEFVNDSIQFNRFLDHTLEMRNVLLLKKNHLSDKQDEIDFLIQLLDNIKAMASDYYLNNTGTKTEDGWKAKDSNVRDKLMAENLVYLANKYPNKKIMCWGATAHFANAVWQLEHEELKEFAPMGSHLKKQIGEEQIYILAFTALNDKTQYQSCIEQEFMTKNARYGILDLKSSAVQTQFASCCIDPNERAIYGDWKEVVDGLFFLDTIIRSTPYLHSLEYEDDKPIQQDFTSTEKPSEQNKLNINRQNVYAYQIIQGHGNNLLIESSKVEDIKTKEAIPYVNIGIRETLIGTSTDINGNFTIKIPIQYRSDTLSFSCIGYQTERIAVQNLSQHQTIDLTPAVENLSEITIREERLTAELIMNRVIENIEQNYIQSAYSQLRLYRKRIWQADRGKFYLHEELRDVYDDNGYKSVPMYPIRYEGFSVSNQARIATIDSVSGQVHEFENSEIPIRGAIALSDVMDVRHNNFCNKRLFSKYEFELKKIISSEIGEQYLISFRAKKPKSRTTAQLAPLDYNGTITINAADYAILQVNSTVIQDKEKIWLADKNPAYKTENVWFEKEIVSYKKNGSYYYLNKLHRICNWKLSKNGFIEIFGFGVQEGKQARPEKDELFNKHTEENYNPDDWNFLSKSSLIH